MIYSGNTKIGELYYGNQKIKEAYYGSTKVYTSFVPQTVRFDYTGDVQTWTVPSGCTKLIVDCVGAAGGGNTDYLGGNGGRVQCSLSVTPGQILYFYVGGKGTCDTSYTGASTRINTGGWNGGGSSNSLNNGNYYSYFGSGGGSSDIRTTNGDLNTRLVVAGAGSGGYHDQFQNQYNINIPGANGGGLTGADGTGAGTSTDFGKGGTQTSGGASGGLYDAENGQFLYGGKGGYAEGWGVFAGTGGGSGWYGGGGGSTGTGGGGSSYTDPTLCSDVVHTQGYSEATGNGWIIITTSNQ